MLRCYAIYDYRLEAFMRPFCAETDGVAWRAFRDLVLDKSHPVGQWPADYELHYLGKWFPSTGKYECPETSICVASGDVLYRSGINGQLDIEEAQLADNLEEEMHQ